MNNDEHKDGWRRAMMISRRALPGMIGLACFVFSATGALGIEEGADPHASLIPVDKNLSREWIENLYRRGSPEYVSGKALKYIGMPVGGMGCGQLYLAGDGRLWLWDIFKSNYDREPLGDLSFDLMTMNGHYTKPVDSLTGQYSARNGADVDQGFIIRVKQGESTQTRSLDQKGFPGVKFRGEYPIGRVIYSENDFPVRVELEAFSPFIPLNANSSALPATVLSFSVRNTGNSAVEVDLLGWLQNATCPYNREATLGTRSNTLRALKAKVATLLCTVEAGPDKEMESRHGFGSMALSVMNADEKRLYGSTDAELPVTGQTFPAAYKPGETTRKPLDRKLVGTLGERLSLKPGETGKVEFLLTWYFPFHQDKGGEMARGVTDFAELSRHYRSWFSDAAGVADRIAGDYDHYLQDTRLWNRTWYDSTLPYWLLDRCFIAIDCLATQTFHYFDNGRIWAWEGVDSCGGTCTHVWNYAQGMARIFPELERSLREQVDFGLAFKNGGIGNRGEGTTPATDGQAGTIVRVWREHTISPDDAFLRRLWPKVKQAIDYLIAQDPNQDGLLEGVQENTLDAAWYGPMGWISSVYGAALRAGQMMAHDMGDQAMEEKCRTIADRGEKEIVKRVFNGEYFIHIPPDYKRINSNKGCHIDQVLGQSWAVQMNLPRVLPKKETVSALNAIWKYNFAPDAGGYAIKHKAIKGHRTYAEEGEAGVIMTTWPHGGAELAVPGMADRQENNSWIGPGGYFDECMGGFEYQVAANMIYEGAPESELITRGLAITRALHERYAAAKRNPYNEIECGDHYARAMASYGVFLAVCGFEYHGPEGHIGFDPQITPEHFKAPFTVAQGWGTYSQTVKPDGSLPGEKALEAKIALKYGSLRLRTLSLGLVGDMKPNKAKVSLNGNVLDCDLKIENGRARIALGADTVVKAGETISTTLQ
jgi:non-lysosomal glucosylceramidase